MYIRHHYHNTCPENYNLITNFDKEREPIFRKAIERFGYDGLIITKDAYWMNGTKDNGMYALRWKNEDSHMDLSHFWRIVKDIEGR